MLKIICVMAFSFMLIGCASKPKKPVQIIQKPVVDLTAAAKINIKLGIIYLKQNDVQRAKTKLLTALKQDPSLPNVYSSLGLLYEKTGQHDLANTYYSRAIDMAPQLGALHSNYGAYLCKMKHYSKAMQQFELASRDADYINVSQNYENAAICQQMQGHYEQASVYYNKALKQDPGNLNAKLSLAEVYLYMNKMGQAMQQLREFENQSKPNVRSATLGVDVSKAAKNRKAYDYYREQLQRLNRG